MEYIIKYTGDILSLGYPTELLDAQFAAAEALGPRWGGAFHMAEAGPIWLDFTLADKGSGLADLCRVLGIAMEDVMAFGDNYNDLPMLEQVGQPYLMENAAPALRAKIPRLCRTVVEVLSQIQNGAPA